VFRVDRKRGPVWYAKYRSPDGRQVQRKLGPAWSERGRPPAGYFTKRLAEDWLREVLDEARRGTRAMRLEDVTTDHVERWVAGMDCKAATRTKALVILHGIFQRACKVHRLPANPVSDVEKPPQTRSGYIQVVSPEGVWALVRAAKSEQDSAIFLTAAFTGLRQGELLALRWRDVDSAGSVVRVRASYPSISIVS